MESLKKQAQKILGDVRGFLRLDDGLVTVEWVALTAAMVIAAVVISFTVMNNTSNEANKVGNDVTKSVNDIYGDKGGNLKPK